MKKEKEKLKAEMMAEAEKIIDELIKWEENNPKPTLAQIEDIVLEQRKRMSERLAEALINRQENRQPVPGPSCPKCGEEMRYKGQKGNRVESQAGELRLERGYYYCEKCKQGSFPPG